MAFLVYSPTYDIYKKLSTYSKYVEYMKDVENFISPYHHEQQPLRVFRKYLKFTGFMPKHLEIRDQVYIYKNIDQLRSKYQVL